MKKEKSIGCKGGTSNHVEFSCCGCLTYFNKSTVTPTTRDFPSTYESEQEDQVEITIRRHHKRRVVSGQPKKPTTPKHKRKVAKLKSLSMASLETPTKRQ